MARESPALVALEAAEGDRFPGVLEDLVFRLPAQDLVDLILQRRALLAREPPLPVVQCLPGADDEILLGVVGAAQRLPGDVSGLTGRERPELRDEIQKRLPCPA